MQTGENSVVVQNECLERKSLNLSLTDLSRKTCNSCAVCWYCTTDVQSEVKLETNLVLI